MRMEGYEIRGKVGYGSYGVVYAALDKKSLKMVAIKLIKDLFRHPIEAKKVLREIKLLSNNHQTSNISLLFYLSLEQVGFVVFHDGKLLDTEGK